MDAPLYLEANRAKLWLYFVGSLGFVAGGVWIAVSPATFVNPIISAEWALSLTGAICGCFFAFCAFAIGRLLRRAGQGVMLGVEGIMLHGNGPEVGLIEWADLTGCHTTKPFGAPRMLVLATDKPEKYLARIENTVVKVTRKADHRLIGSPLWINTDTLSVAHDRVEQIISERITANRR